MADNIPTKSTKTNDKPKQSNVIHRTTTETIRLGEAESVPVSNNTSVVNSQRKKPCSFQITSVIVGRMNNDGGDDSADDLDESHADDISDVNSRITDNETPSYSEDTYSKEDIFFNVSSSSLCSAPVIPTSAQYGLAIVSPGTTGNSTNKDSSGSAQSVAGATDVNVTVASVGLEHTHASKLHEQENKDMQSTPGRNDRFKVVKIESTEPFKRGRWSCMDFLDSANQPYSLACTRADGNASLQVSTTVYTSECSTMADFPSGNNIPTVFQQQTQSLPPQQLNQNIVQPNPVHMPQSQTQYYTAHMQNTQQPLNVPFSQQTSQGIQQPQAQYSVQQPAQQIGLQSMMVPVQQVAHNVVGNQGQMSQMGIVQGQVMTQQNIGQTQNSSSVVTQPAMPYSQQSSSFPPTSSSVQMPSQYVAQSQTFSTQSSQQHMIPQQSVYSSQPVPGSVPANVQGQSYSSNQGQSYSSQSAQGQSYAGQLSQPITSNVPTQGQSYAGHTSTAQAQTYSSLQGQTQAQSFASQQTQTTYAQPIIQQAPYIQQQSQNFQAQGQAYVSQPQGSYQGVPPTQMYNQNVSGITNSQQSQNYVVSMPSSPASVPQQPIYPSTTTEQQAYTQPQQNYVPTTGNFPAQGQSYSAVGNIGPQGNYQGTYRQGNQSRTLPTYTSSQFKAATTTSGDGPSPSEAPAVVPQDTPAEATGINEETQAPPDDADCAAGNSAVAIDNKIEQAMDLVKSHLMFAVREEVEVLKERIAELMDRINQLETENSILKSHATQETLAQLTPPPAVGHSLPVTSQSISPGTGATSGST